MISNAKVAFYYSLKFCFFSWVWMICFKLWLHNESLTFIMSSKQSRWKHGILVSTGWREEEYSLILKWKSEVGAGHIFIALGLRGRGEFLSFSLYLPNLREETDYVYLGCSILIQWTGGRYLQPLYAGILENPFRALWATLEQRRKDTHIGASSRIDPAGLRYTDLQDQ